MTEGAEGCSDDPLAYSFQLDVASGGPSSESQQPESQAEVSTLCIPSADDDIDKIIAGEWHGGECKSMYAACEVTYLFIDISLIVKGRPSLSICRCFNFYLFSIYYTILIINKNIKMRKIYLSELFKQIVLSYIIYLEVDVTYFMYLNRF